MSLLAPDELPIQLLPGPAAALVADCPQQLQCSTQGVLDALPIKAVDAYGNLMDTCSFDVRTTQHCPVWQPWWFCACKSRTCSHPQAELC